MELVSKGVPVPLHHATELIQSIHTLVYGGLVPVRNECFSVLTFFVNQSLTMDSTVLVPTVSCQLVINIWIVAVF
jgi:hypothetical protein